MNYRELVSLYEGRDAEDANDLLARLLKGKHVRADHVDLGRLFEECCGRSNYLDCKSGYDRTMRFLKENQGAVTTAHFQNIQGQIAYSMIMDAYEMEEGVFTKLIPEVMTSFLDGEKIAGVTEIGDEVAVRPEGRPYTLAGVSEDWIFTPPVVDRGFIVPVTWEVLFADRTGVLQDRLRAAGKWGARNREKRAIDAVIDENTVSHRYNWRGTVIATYGNNTGSHTWDNLEASNALVDWTDVNAVEQLANAVTDPFTGEVADFELRHLIVTKQLEQTARRIVRQGSIAYTTPGYATSGNVSQHLGDNPYANKYEVVTTKLLASRLATDTDWFVGDVTKAVKCMVVEKPTTQEAPPNTADDFHRRIVNQYRYNDRLQYVVVQPRALFKSTVS